MKRLKTLPLMLAAVCMAIALPTMTFAQAAAPAKAEKKTGGKQAPATAVDLNNAAQSELESVPGIGAATAKKIVAGRPYSSVNDLSKAGLSAKQIAQISPNVKVGAASAAAKPSSMAPVKPSATASTSAPAPVPTKADKIPAPAKVAPTASAAGQTCASDMVWVNTETKVFHKSGDKYFANTKKGKCMSEADAVKAGYRASKQK